MANKKNDYLTDKDGTKWYYQPQEETPKRINPKTGKEYMMSYDEYLKYNKPGIYSISVMENGYLHLLYIGKSVNMYNRILTHVREILKDFPTERKYQIMHNIKENGFKIKFDVVQYWNPDCGLSIEDLEQSWIDFYQPPLNTLGIADDRTIDERLADNPKLFWLLELHNGAFDL